MRVVALQNNNSCQRSSERWIVDTRIMIIMMMAMIMLLSKSSRRGIYLLVVVSEREMTCHTLTIERPDLRDMLNMQHVV